MPKPIEEAIKNLEVYGGRISIRETLEGHHYNNFLDRSQCYM